MAAERPWNAKGTGCCSPFGTCMLTTFCPCITFGRIRQRMKEGPKDSYSSCNGSCWGFCGLACLGFSWVFQAMNRSSMREKYGLEGNLCTDFLCACCCTCCDLIQQDKEAKFREEERAGLIVGGQPVKQGQMTYQQPPHPNGGGYGGNPY